MINNTLKVITVSPELTNLINISMKVNPMFEECQKILSSQQFQNTTKILNYTSQLNEIFQTQTISTYQRIFAELNQSTTHLKAINDLFQNIENHPDKFKNLDYDLPIGDFIEEAYKIHQENTDDNSVSVDNECTKLQTEEILHNIKIILCEGYENCTPIFKEKIENLDTGTIQDFIILLTFVLIKANILHDDYHEIFTNLSEYTVATLYLLKIVEKNVKK